MEYELFDKQDDFVFDEHRFSAYGGGFGNGKTLAGAIKTYNHCMKNRDAFFLVGRRHATDLSDSTQRDFLGLFGHLGKFSPKNNSFRFYREGQPWSEVIFRHLDDMQSLTNMNLSGFWIDQAEEVTVDAFDFLVGRIRRPVRIRQGFITYNPNGHDWIWQRFIKKKARNGDPLPNMNDYYVVLASTLENEKNLPKDYVDSLMAMPKEWKKRFVYGSHDVMAGQIFDDFRPSVHVLPQAFQIPNTWERFRVIDHGQSTVTCCLWMAVDYDGNIFVYQEYYQEDRIVSQHCEAINEMSQIRTTDGQVLQDVYSCTLIDPSTHAKTLAKDGRLYSVADEYLDAGIPTIAAQNDVLAGINRVKEYMMIDPERYHPFLRDEDGPIKGAPMLFIFPGCENLIEEIPEYKWKAYSGTALGNPDRDAIKEAPRKIKDHAVDCLRYGLMSRPQSPRRLQQIEPWVFQHPLELARRAQALGVTVNDLMAARAGIRRTSIRHSETGIRHTSSLKNNALPYNN